MIDWSYPFWIAHRGAGKIAPENTLSAFKKGSSYGYSMFECDVKLSQDNVPFLLHDSTLKRTTNAEAHPQYDVSECVSRYSWEQLSQLDAGSWCSQDYAGEKIPRLDAILEYCHQSGSNLNIELKPTLGYEYLTGKVVAQLLEKNWHGEAPPFLTSFSEEALEGVRSITSALPLGFLVETTTSDLDDEITTAQRLGAQALVVDYPLCLPQNIRKVRQYMRLLSYTVNDVEIAKKLIALEIDGVITDKVDTFCPHSKQL